MMRFTFKTLPYQSDAVNCIVRAFDGQEYNSNIRHLHDFGSEKGHQLKIDDDMNVPAEDYTTAFSNNNITIPKEKLLENIQAIQRELGLHIDDKIEKPLGAVTLDVEMETGTGKTYVYTKMMYELNKRYGWSKYIIVVPSIAIREGVAKSIQTTADHFMEQYGKKLRSFIYSSSNLNKIDEYSQSSGINVMIINSQAFATSLKDGAKNKESRIIYSERDEFQSRRPIDIIKGNHPILILDEPQKLNGDATQKALRTNFNVLFSVNFSATHVVEHNKIYSLDALDAYNKKLVKKIEVKGIDVNHTSSTNRYIYFETIVTNGKAKPTARIELSVNHSNGIRRESHIINYQDNLYETSNRIEAYKDLFVTDIDGITDKISFSDGTILHAGESMGDINEDNKRRIQIRETILSHLDKEQKWFKNGIKVLSLFFIDEVSKYRQYDDNTGEEILGEYGRIFEEEFNNILRERGFTYDQDYINQLKQSPVSKIHAGYFSIDKKGHMSNGDIKKGSDESNDVSAYDLILKNKEKLLSYDTPVRFIFSHSALSEGWDNPNVFQICVLKHSESTTRRRQEVGRGMRICVDQNGDRQDLETLGPMFHEVNLLTVVADEDYESFVKGLQSEMNDELRARLIPITKEYLTNKKIIVKEKGEFLIDSMQAHTIYKYLLINDYVDDKDYPTDKLKDAVRNNGLAPLPLQLTEISSGIRDLLKKCADPISIREMYVDGRKPKIKENKLNANFKKKEFIELWNEINHMYHYKVSFDSNELIRNAVKQIDDELFVSKQTCTIKTGSQRSEIQYEQALDKDGFNTANTRTVELNVSSYSDVKYDLIGKIASGTGLTRKTIAKILYDIENKKFDMFKDNPEEFITKVCRIINEVKATTIVDHITYVPTEDKFDNDIFTVNRPEGEYAKAYTSENTKNIQDFLFTDSKVERAFATELDGAEEVCVYAKLPDGKGGFYIPTPVGDYSPDWAIAFNKGSVRHVYFVAETKGSMSTMTLDKIEESKIKCVTRLFEEINTDVKFGKIDSYGNLLDLIRGME